MPLSSKTRAKREDSQHVVIYERFWEREFGAALTLCTLQKGIGLLVSKYMGEGVEHRSRGLVPSPAKGEEV